MRVLDGNYLAVTALVTIGMQLLFFVVAARFKFDKVTDFAGGTNFLVLALLTLFLGGTYFARQVVLTTMVAVWALRIAGYLLYRIIRIGEDHRFDDKRDKLCAFFGFWVFQMSWVWIVSLPLTVTNAFGVPAPLGPRDYVGWAMWVGGFLLETVADQQKFTFRNNPANKGKFCDVGLWRVSRHPNYFGEILLWFGVFTAATAIAGPYDAVHRTSVYFIIASPLYVSFLLLFLSGVPLLEKGSMQRYGRDPAYLEYVRATSMLVPLPRRVYAALPAAAQCLLCQFPNLPLEPLPSAAGDASETLGAGAKSYAHYGSAAVNDGAGVADARR